MKHGGKRAGAGRKVGSKNKQPRMKKTKRLNIWLDADLRRSLAASAQQQRHTLSEEIRNLLRDAAKGRSEMLEWCGGSETNLGLVQLIARMISEVDRITQKPWRTDAFSFELLTSGLSWIFRELKQYIRPNTVELPESVREGPNDTRDPIAIAQTLGFVLGNAVWTEMRLIQSPTIRELEKTRYQNVFSELPRMRDRLKIDPIPIVKD